MKPDSLLPDLEVRGIVVHIGTQTILSDVSFSAGPSEIVVIVGPSGSGKTTLLRVVAGLIHPWSGCVAVKGRDVTRLQPPARRVGMVFQDLALYPALNVEGNLEFPLRVQGLSRAVRRTRVQEMSKRLEIDRLLRRQVSQLSGGERQRVAIGRALIRNPDLFLLDEPLSSIDAALQDDIRSLILEIQRSLGVSMIYVTHNQVEAWRIADRIGVMNDGKLMQIGAPTDLYHAPINTFVARFVSDVPMNVVDIQALTGGSREATIQQWSTARIIGMRMDDVRVGRPQEQMPSNAIQVQAKVSAVERFAERVIAVAALGGTHMRGVVADDGSVRPGEVVTFCIESRDCYLFDESGQLLKPKELAR